MNVPLFTLTWERDGLRIDWWTVRVPGWLIAVIVGLVLMALAIPRASAADWKLHYRKPGETWAPKPHVYDQATACATDAASLAYALPSGSRVVCLRVEPTKEVRK